MPPSPQPALLQYLHQRLTSAFVGRLVTSEALHRAKLLTEAVLEELKADGNYDNYGDVEVEMVGTALKVSFVCRLPGEMEERAVLEVDPSLSPTKKDEEYEGIVATRKEEAEW